MNAAYLECQKRAAEIVASYRTQAPAGCDPQNVVATSTALIIAAVALTVAGTAVSVYGQYAQGQAQKNMAEYNAKIANNNARASQQQAGYEAGRIRDRNRRIQATQAVGFLKSGVELSGSAQDVMYDSSLEGEMDALSVVYKGNVSSNASQASSTMYGLEGNAAVDRARYGMAGTALSGAGSVASMGGGAYNNEVHARNPQFQS